VAVMPRVLHWDFFALRAVEHEVQLSFGQLADGLVQVDMGTFSQGFEHLPVVAAFLARARPF